MRRVEKLTEKQKRFVDFYIQTGNASEAARLAGYNPKSAGSIGQENLKKPEIKNAIDARLKQLESERVAKDKEILEFLTAVMRGEVIESIPTQIGTGNGVFHAELLKKPPNVKDRLKAAEILSKINGLFNEKTEVKVDAAQLLIDTLSSVWERRDE